MAQKANGDKHDGVTTVNAQGVTKTIIVEVEVLNGRIVTKPAADIGVKQ